MKQKVLRFKKGSKKDSEAIGAHFQFDVLVQLVNILARITLYELLRLFKTTRDTLRETLTDSDTFPVQIT